MKSLFRRLGFFALVIVLMLEMLFVFGDSFVAAACRGQINTPTVNASGHLTMHLQERSGLCGW